MSMLGDNEDHQHEHFVFWLNRSSHKKILLPTSERLKPPVLWIEDNGILKVSLRDIKEVFLHGISMMEILGGHFVRPHKSII